MNNETVCIHLTKFCMAPYIGFAQSYQISYITVLLRSDIDKPEQTVLFINI